MVTVVRISIAPVLLLLDDAKTGKINLIIVKDLSRFGRNNIQVGQYIDYIFPTTFAINTHAFNEVKVKSIDNIAEMLQINNNIAIKPELSRFDQNLTKARNLI